MRAGMDVWPVYGGLVLGLVCTGCGEFRNHNTGQVRREPPPRAEVKPPPNLRITTPPAAPTADPIPTTPPAGSPVQRAAATQPAPPAPADADPQAALRRLRDAAAERYAAIDSYIVRLQRREQVGDKDKPLEILHVKFRKQPWSVHLKWIGPGEGQGREVVYVKGQYEDKLHTRLAAGDMPLAPAGKRIALAPDSPFVRSASRYPITEAGVGALIDRFGQLAEAAAKGDPRAGSVKYLGWVSRPEFQAPVEGVEQVLAPGAEPLLPRGGRRQVFFDPKSGLPVVVATQDDKGKEVEYYCYDRFQYPVKLDNDDFNPDKLWK
jgi:hypothetical protein